MESVLDSILSAESEDSVINEELDAWEAEFKRDAKHLDVDDDEWRYDGDEEDRSICSEKMDDDVNPRGDEIQDVYDDRHSHCQLASSTRSHLKYGAHVSAFPYVFPANEWSHEYPLTTCDLGLKSGFTCSEDDVVKHILETLLGFPNDLFDLVPTDDNPRDIQQFVLSFSVMHMRIATKLSVKTLHTILQWFAQLASDIHFCRRFAFNAPDHQDNDNDHDIDKLAKGHYSVPSSSSSPASMAAVESLLRSVVLDLLVTVDRDLCLLDKKHNNSSNNNNISSIGVSQSTKHEPYQLTLISLYNHVSARQWTSTFSSLRAQISSVIATARFEAEEPSVVPGLLTNGLMQAHFAMLRWRTITHSREGERLSSTLFSQCHSSPSSSSITRAGKGLSDRTHSGRLTDLQQQQHAGQGLGHSTELTAFLRHLTVSTSSSGSGDGNNGVGVSSGVVGSHDSSSEVAAAAEEFFLGRPLVSSSLSSSESLLYSTSDSRPSKDTAIVTDTDSTVTPGTRINNSGNRSNNNSSNNSNSSSSRINTGLNYFQQLLGCDEHDLDDSGHTDNDNDNDDGEDEDDYDNDDMNDHDGDHDVSLSPRVPRPDDSLGFDVSELMPWAHQLDLIVSLPLARDRRRRDLAATRYLWGPVCRLAAHLKVFADVFLLRDQDLFEPLRLDLLHLDHSNSNKSIINESNRRSVDIRHGGVGAFSQQVQGRTSYVMHSLALCEALTHRLARQTSPCLGSGFAAVFTVRARGDKGADKHHDKGLDIGVTRNVLGKNKGSDGDEEEDVFRIDGAISLGIEADMAGGVPPQAVAGAVGSITQSWRIMRRLVAEVHLTGSPPLLEVFPSESLARYNLVMAHLLPLTAARWAADGAWMASMRASHAFLPPHPSSTSSSRGNRERGGEDGVSRRAKCRAGLSLLVGTLSVLQTYYMRGIHGRILTHYAVVFESCESVAELRYQHGCMLEAVWGVVQLARQEALQVFRIGYGAATAVHLALVMIRWLDSDTADRFRCEAKDVEIQLEQAAGLFDKFRLAVDRLAQTLQRQTSPFSSTSSSSSSFAYTNKHMSQEETTNRNNHYSQQHHPFYRVSDEETAKMLASAQGLAEDLNRI